MKPNVDSAIQPSGNLYAADWYLYWEVGSSEATLDGKFTASELRAIADYIDKKNGVA